VAGEMVLTRVPMERSADPWKMAEAMKELPTTVSDDPRQALRLLLDRARLDDAILVTGSLYLLGEVRPMLLEMAARSRRCGARPALPSG